MLMMVLHDLKGREVYINPYYVGAVYPAADFSAANISGSVVALHGTQIQVSESPGAIFYLLKQTPPLPHDFQ